MNGFFVSSGFRSKNRIKIYIIYIQYVEKISGMIFMNESDIAAPHIFINYWFMYCCKPEETLTNRQSLLNLLGHDGKLVCINWTH